MSLADDTPWRRCEIAWVDHLREAGYTVTRLSELEGNARETRAPMMENRAGLLRAPDIEAAKPDDAAYWEVKYRKRAEINPDTGEPEYWMSHASFSDYNEVAEGTGEPVMVVLLDRSAWDEDRQWRGATIQAIARAGRKEKRFGAGGVLVEAWVWPASHMELIDGPHVDLSEPDDTVFPVEGLGDRETPLNFRDLAALERALRSAEPPSAEDDLGLGGDPARGAELIRAVEPAQDALEVLRLSLGIPEYPRYSVLRVGLGGIDLDDLLTLPRYGIRLFLVTSDKPTYGADETEIQAFRESRLLEWAIVPELESEPRWIVDGRGFEADAHARAVLEAGEEAGGLNAAQYEIVHTGAERDIIVTAGAGTGKTETMSERILYLLATSAVRGDVDGTSIRPLRLDDIVLITFSKESAAEMRKRIARTLMVRQRLCSRSTLPTIAWLTQLSSTDVDTIHSYAKKLVQQNGSAIGFAPGFRVSSQAMEFARLVREVLSPKLVSLFTDFPTRAPAAHSTVEFVSDLWKKLAGNGLSPFALPGLAPRRQVRWGEEDRLHGMAKRVNETLASALDGIGTAFGLLCVEDQSLPVDELVGAGKRTVEAVRAAGDHLRNTPRYLFIDEFQDTDSEQMDLILTLRESLDARLYAVGDPKQAVYRFRGAQGNALAELEARARHLQPASFTLTRNFRTDGVLLDALHQWFRRWGGEGLLDYDIARDRLKAAAPVARIGRPPSVTPSNRASGVTVRGGRRSARDEGAAVQVVEAWWRDTEDASIAVLCRRNWQALRIRELLRDREIPCEIRVGGDFFRTPAVRETATFIRAVLNPEDDAAVLQLCESRWFYGLQGLTPPPDDQAMNPRVWQTGPVMMPMPWHARMASLDPAGSFDRSDLSPLRERLKGLSQRLRMMPTFSWLLECRESMHPDRVGLENEIDNLERHRYSRCFDHLIALLDATFGDAAISPHQTLEWLEHQIATNTREDEPSSPKGAGGRSVVAMTVHKAKGLEFDRVLVPFASTDFGTPMGATPISVVSDKGTPTVLWEWEDMINAPRGTSDLWSQDTAEVRREETRLLYVAMTRARRELVIFSEAGNRTRLARWDDLL